MMPYFATVSELPISADLKSSTTSASAAFENEPTSTASAERLTDISAASFRVNPIGTSRSWKLLV